MSQEITKESEPFPEAYTPFLPVIERLSDPLTSILRGHLLSLEALLQAVQNRDRHIVGDFEGVGGLTQRGDISRILQSELLLRSEAPLEFLRRVAEHETLYMETEHSDPGEKLTYRVMISVGPNMLGHSRLVALACLIFLARIALSRKAELHWCYLPTINAPVWFEGVNINSIKRFLKFASYREASVSDYEKACNIWEDLHAEDLARDHIRQSWVVRPTDPRAEDFSNHDAVENALTIAMDPPAFDGPQSAVLDLQKRGRNIRRLAMTFPDERVCTSALNHPFRPYRPKPRRDTADAGNARIPVLGGWEPRFLVSSNASNFIIRFEHYRRGLGFIVLKSGQVEKVAHLPLPENILLAGVENIPFQSCPGLMLQNTVESEESLINASIAYDGKSLNGARRKIVTSRHLFSKQGSHAIPGLSHKIGIRCFTTLGQPFLFKIADPSDVKIVIEYRENRILHSDGEYRVEIFNPADATMSERMQKNRGAEFDGPAFQVFRESGKFIAAFPGEPDMTPNRLRAMIFTPSTRCLAYCHQAGHWRIMQNPRASRSSRQALNPSSINILDVTLPLYERVITSNIKSGVAKLLVYSDPSLGGENQLRYVWHDENGFLRKQTALKLGNSRPLVQLRKRTDGKFSAVYLDEHGDPGTLVILKKHGGTLTKFEYDLDHVLNYSDDIAIESVLG